MYNVCTIDIASVCMRTYINSNVYTMSNCIGLFKLSFSCFDMHH